MLPSQSRSPTVRGQVRVDTADSKTQPFRPKMPATGECKDSPCIAPAVAVLIEIDSPFVPSCLVACAFSLHPFIPLSPCPFVPLPPSWFIAVLIAHRSTRHCAPHTFLLCKAQSASREKNRPRAK